MIITYCTYSGFDRPFHIKYLSTFLNCLFEEPHHKFDETCRLYDDEGHLIGRAATYQGV